MSVHAVTPNPALDVTYRVAAPVVVHGTNRISSVSARPGGKGVNVARLVAAAGGEVATYGFIGGVTGTQLRELLITYAPTVVQRWTDVATDTRRTIALTDGHDTTMLNEPGGRVVPEDWSRLTTELTRQSSSGDVVTVSGSLPPGSSPEDVAALVSAARERGAVVIADTSGPALLAAARAGADLLKPNREELIEALGYADLATGVRILLDAGAGAVLTSLGSEGMRLDDGRLSVTARLNEPVRGNPTGAGDAVVAALARAVAAHPDPAQRSTVLRNALPDAVAWSAAAVLSPVAGEIDAATVDSFTPHVQIMES